MTSCSTQIFDSLFDTQGAALIRDTNGALSRADVLQQAQTVAGRLQYCGLKPGERVAVLCVSPREAIIGFLAVMMTPYCAVPIHPASPPAMIDHVIANSGARIVVRDNLPENIETQLAELEHVSTLAIPEGVEVAERTPPPASNDLAALLYTSGTTGTPKGVQISYGNIESMADKLVTDFFRVDHSDTLLMAAPLTNIFGVALLAVALQTRSCLSIPPDLRPANLLETLKRDRVTFIAGVPMLAGMMLRAVSDIENPLPDLRRVLFAGTKLDHKIAKAFGAKFDTEVMTGYAMTEAVPISMALDMSKTNDGSVGTICRDIQLQIVDANMKVVESGARGEILIKGPSVTSGYWQAPELTQTAFHDGWFRTGDIGKLDADGQLVLIDRVSEIIKSAGNTVYPSEVEQTLRDSPDVQDVAVLGIPHESYGEIVVAYIVPKQGQKCDPIELKAFCADRLLSWKMPRQYISVDSFPMTATGKVSKFRLRASHGTPA